MNRRDFARRSTTALIGGMVASRSPLSYPPEQHPADTIRIGLIGCGGRGTGAAIQALKAHPGVRLVAMADAFPDRLEEAYNAMIEAAEEDSSRIDVPKERRFTGFQAYEKVIPLVDVVLLTTPPGFRPIHFEAAVDAGKHVFMEKPVATDAPGVRRVLEAAKKAREKQLNVVVGLQRRYQSMYRDWIDQLRNGAIGDLTLGRVYWNGGGVWVRERRPEWNEMEYQMRNWYYFTWICGDHIVEQHIHNIDVANWAKQAHPVRAQGQGGRLVRNGPNHGQIFDHHFVEFAYEDDTRLISQCRHMPNTWRHVSEAFHGTHGTAPRPGLILNAEGKPIFRYDSDADPNPYQEEHNQLFDAVAAGEYRLDDAENGAVATMTAIMGRMATYSGNEVTWDEALNSEVNLMPERYAMDAAPPVLPDARGGYPVPVPGETTVV